MNAKWTLSLFGFLSVFILGLDADAACRVTNYPSVTVSTRDRLNVLYGVARLYASVSQPSVQGDSPFENCSNSYSTSFYLNNRFIGYGDVLDFNTAFYADGVYTLRAEMTLSSNVYGYYPNSSSITVEIRNNWLRPEIFDLSSYLNANPDVRNAFGGDINRSINHWLFYGVKEGRQGSANFRSKEYLDNYPDLQNAFGPTNYVAAIEHYLAYGINEGRLGLASAQFVTYDSQVAIRSIYGTYLSAEYGGGSWITSGRSWALGWETFTLRAGSGVIRSGASFAMQTLNGNYVSAICGGGEGGDCGEVNTQNWILGWETFKLIKIGGNAGDLIRRGDRVAIQSMNGQYCAATGGGGEGSRFICKVPWIQDWETFVMQ